MAKPRRHIPTLGEVILKLRTSRNMSLQDVADEAGLTKAHVWELENGRQFNPKISTLWGLATALNCSPVDLAATALADKRFSQ